MKTLLLLLLLLPATLLHAQDQQSLVVRELKQLSERYRTSPYLSFNVRYRQASDTLSAEPPDSLDGTFKMNGGSFWNRIDQTQTFFNGQYLVAVYPQDSILYISKPTASVNPINQLVAIDSLLASRKINYHYTKEKNTIRLLLEFTDNPQLKSVCYELNRKTGWIDKITQVVSSVQLMDTEDQQDPNAPAGLSTVVTDFSGYQTNSFTGDVFKSDNYFMQEGKSFTPSLAYRGYKIVSANTDQP